MHESWLFCALARRHNTPARRSSPRKSAVRVPADRREVPQGSHLPCSRTFACSM